jgi:hypothetical protein
MMADLAGSWLISCNIRKAKGESKEMANKYRIFQEVLADLCKELGYDAGDKVPKRDLWFLAEAKIDNDRPFTAEEIEVAINQ